mmetsp:Transcript_22788/g.53762  ORF Transcript_22788/g.53762 Transcript_22788/m.53762 type:complete len:416 (+) Transcript_22788:133-1380(+)
MLHPSGCDENRATRSCRRVCRKLALVTLLAIALRIAVRVYYCPCPDGPSSKPRRGEEVAPSSALRRLEQPCADSPTFVTYGVGGGALRTSLGGGKLWDHSDVRSALRVMYSSLVRSFGCSPTLHMHTTMSPETARTRYLPPTTTMGSRISGRSVVFHRMNASFMENPFAVNAFNTWLALSRSKLDTFELHLRDGASTVWIDLDTVVLDKIAVNATAPWVYAYHHGRKEDIHKSKNFVYGDMWSLDRKAIHDIRDLEMRLLEANGAGIGFAAQFDRRNWLGKNAVWKGLPEYDLQGYFHLLLREDRSSLAVVQDLHPENAFGFDCSGNQHPSPENLGKKIRGWDEEGAGLGCGEDGFGRLRKAASISFTSTTFKQVFQTIFSDSSRDGAFPFIEDEAGRNYLQQFFFETNDGAVVR